MKFQPANSPLVALPMLDVYLPMMRSAAILTAAELNLFNALNGNPLTETEISEKIGVKPKGLKCLLDMLIVAGYVERAGEGYTATAFAKSWFSQESPFDYTAGLLWSMDAWHMLEELGDVIKKGHPSPTLWERMRLKPEMGRKFSQYMRAFARHCIPDFQRIVTLPPQAKRLLDIGGSHGLHSVAFCQKYPGLQAVVFDFPESLLETGPTIREHGLEGRISVQPGNAVTDDFGSGYDAALFFSLIHNHAPEDNLRMLDKIAKALNPGGLIVIQEYMGDGPTSAFNAAFNLTLFLEVGTRISTFPEISHWLTESGFMGIRRTDLNPLEKGTVITAVKR